MESQLDHLSEIGVVTGFDDEPRLGLHRPPMPVADAGRAEELHEGHLLPEKRLDPLSHAGRRPPGDLAGLSLLLQLLADFDELPHLLLRLALYRLGIDCGQRRAVPLLQRFQNRPGGRPAAGQRLEGLANRIDLLEVLRHLQAQNGLLVPNALGLLFCALQVTCDGLHATVQVFDVRILGNPFLAETAALGELLHFLLQHHDVSRQMLLLALHHQAEVLLGTLLDLKALLANLPHLRGPLPASRDHGLVVLLERRLAAQEERHPRRDLAVVLVVELQQQLRGLGKELLQLIQLLRVRGLLEQAGGDSGEFLVHLRQVLPVVALDGVHVHVVHLVGLAREDLLHLDGSHRKEREVHGVGNESVKLIAPFSQALSGLAQRGQTVYRALSEFPRIQHLASRTLGLAIQEIFEALEALEKSRRTLEKVRQVVAEAPLGVHHLLVPFSHPGRSQLPRLRAFRMEDVCRLDVDIYLAIRHGDLAARPSQRVHAAAQRLLNRAQRRLERHGTGQGSFVLQNAVHPATFVNHVDSSFGQQVENKDRVVKAIRLAKTGEEVPKALDGGFTGAPHLPGHEHRRGFDDVRHPRPPCGPRVQARSGGLAGNDGVAVRLIWAGRAGFVQSLQGHSFPEAVLPLERVGRGLRTPIALHKVSCVPLVVVVVTKGRGVLGLRLVLALGGINRRAVVIPALVAPVRLPLHDRLTNVEVQHLPSRGGPAVLQREMHLAGEGRHGVLELAEPNGQPRSEVIRGDVRQQQGAVGPHALQPRLGAAVKHGLKVLLRQEAVVPKLLQMQHAHIDLVQAPLARQPGLFQCRPGYARFPGDAPAKHAMLVVRPPTGFTQQVRRIDADVQGRVLVL
eukprot:scaffold2923_cov313-Pinguiococcus_pyrenoidosus.AAC.9